jgi:putative tryptophan/tyrosine transport system substrate-binding protein
MSLTMSTCFRRRRGLLAVAGSLAALGVSNPFNALAQARVARIGYLVPRQRSVFLPSIVKRLRELGYREGENLLIEYRSTDGVAGRVVSLARELVEARCELIFLVATEAETRALVKAQPAIPLILISVQYDPVKSGFASNFRRPGGQVTGMYFDLPALGGKYLDLMREIAPKGKRFLVLSDSFATEALQAVRSVARQRRVELIEETFSTPPYDVEAAIGRSRAAGAAAVIVLDSPSFFDHRQRISESVTEHRLPTIVNLHYFDQPGFLIAYGANFASAFFRLGDIAASILKGTKPGVIPIEQPTDFELVLNLKTATALGIAVPQSIVSRAHRLIE